MAPPNPISPIRVWSASSCFASFFVRCAACVCFFATLTSSWIGGQGAFASSAVGERKGSKEVIQVLNRNDDAERIFKVVGATLSKTLDLSAAKSLKWE